MAISISGLLQFLVMVIPSLQVIFKTVWLDLNQWWIVVILSLAPILYVELLKLMKLTYKK
jgi:Ca2+-transporting ATPase